MKKKLRVLQLGKYFSPFKGGIELVSSELARTLNNEEIECDILCLSHDREVHALDVNFRVIRARSLFKLGSVDFSWEYIKELRSVMADYDVIHMHLPNPMAHLAVLLCRPKAKLVLHWHSDIIAQKFLNKFYSPFLKLLIKQSSAVIGATPAHIDESDFSDYFLNKSFLIPYVFDHHKYASIPIDKEAVSKITKKYGGRKIVFSVGRHVYYKGFSDLVEASLHLPDDWVIVIGGSGPDSEALESKIHTLSQQNKVFLTGRLTDEELVNFIDASRVFAFPSVFRSEMFGMVQLEAFSRSKPVVATYIPRSGVPHVNKNGITGFSVPIHRPDKIAAAILDISREGRYEGFCSQAKSWVMANFDHGEIAKKHIEVYESIISKDSIA